MQIKNIEMVGEAIMDWVRTEGDPMRLPEAEEAVPFRTMIGAIACAMETMPIPTQNRDLEFKLENMYLDPEVMVMQSRAKTSLVFQGILWLHKGLTFHPPQTEQYSTALQSFKASS